jgi:catechol 2,3-dioxygenase-like lactoylglutathione lyase family enzyme
MRERVVPMIHVPDVRATVDWYRDIGFTVIDKYDDGAEGLSFAILSFGSSEVMFNQGGRPSTHHRREVDLYIYTKNVDDLHRLLKGRVELVEGVHDTFYGMREFIIRDLNGFWITFAQPSAFEVLMTAVREGNTESVRLALESGGLSPETLTAALVVASADDNKNAEIAQMLKNAGAVQPPEVDNEILQSHVGGYRSEQGLEVNVVFKDGKLIAERAGQQALTLIAVNKTTFRPIAFDDATVSFIVQAGKTTGFTLKQGPNMIQLTRVEESKQ